MTWITSKPRFSNAHTTDFETNNAKKQTTPLLTKYVQFVHTSFDSSIFSQWGKGNNQQQNFAWVLGSNISLYLTSKVQQRTLSSFRGGGSNGSAKFQMLSGWWFCSHPGFFQMAGSYWDVWVCRKGKWQSFCKLGAYVPHSRQIKGIFCNCRYTAACKIIIRQFLANWELRKQKHAYNLVLRKHFQENWRTVFAQHSLNFTLTNPSVLKDMAKTH